MMGINQKSDLFRFRILNQHIYSRIVSPGCRETSGYFYRKGEESMIRMINGVKVFVVLIAILLIGAVPCLAAGKDQGNLGKWSYCDDIRKFADPMTENLLLMINADNYGQFGQDFSQQMKEAIPESKYKEIRDGIQTKFGTYVSKEFVSAEIRENYIAVLYKGKFSQEEEPVLVKSVFVKENNKIRVGGFWLNPLKYAGNVEKQ